MITLIGGGARSGKSSFAEKIALSRGGEEVIYLATAEAGDEEMEARIKNHRKARPEGWKTVEEPRYISQILTGMAPGQVVLVDCITLLVSNLLIRGGGNEEVEDAENRIRREINAALTRSREKEIELILVTNEVGMGLVPDNKLGREYRDIAGRINQLLAREADEVYITYFGLPLEIKQQGLKNLQRFSGRGS